MNHQCKRLLQKIAIKWLRIFSSIEDREPSAYEKECFSVCKALIDQEDSVLLMSPLSGKRFIKSEDDQIFIIIEQNQITIVNHSYSYNIDIWGNGLARITNMFDIEVEKRRDSMEKEIRSNVKHSLSNIYKNLTHAKS
jgi:hypothetical protein